MSETIQPGDIDSEAELLAQHEAWIINTANLIVETRILKVGHIEPDLAIDGVRIASLWVDTLKASLESDPPASADELQERMLAARRIAIAQSETQNRYASGELSIKVTVAMNDAFCLAFEPEDMGEAAKLLEWPMEVYGIVTG